MFYSVELLTRKGVFTLAWLAGTINNASLLNTYLERLMKQNGKANILDICSSLLNPVVPLSLRLRAILMLGIVRLFREQVRQTEKEAQTCWRKVLTQRSSRTALSVSMIDQLVEQETGSQDLLVIWRKNRQVLEEIECRDVNKSSHLSLDFVPFGAHPPVPKSTIWRDQDTEVLGWDVDWLREMEESQNEVDEIARAILPSEDLISIPRTQITVSWPMEPSLEMSTSTESGVGEVDLARAEEDWRRRSSLMPSVGMDGLEIDGASASGGHFLDELIDRSQGMGEGEEEGVDPLRSVFGMSVDELHDKLEDLLEPVDMSVQALDQEALYDVDLDRADTWVDWGHVGGGAAEGSPADEDANGAFLEIPQLEGSTLESLVSTSSPTGVSLNSGDTSISAGSRARRSRILWDRDGTHIPHETLKINLSRSTPPRPDTATLSDPQLLQASIKSPFGSYRATPPEFNPMKTLILPEAPSFRFEGALAYIHVSILASAGIGPHGTKRSHMDSLHTVSFLPESTMDDNAQLDNSILFFPPAALEASLHMMDSPQQVQHQEHQDEYDQYDNYVDFGPIAPVQEGMEGGEIVHFEAAPDPSSSVMLDSSQRSTHSSRASQRSIDSSSLAKSSIQISRISNALLGYITVKAAPPLSTSVNDTSATQSRHEPGANPKLMLHGLLDGCKRRTAAKTFLHLLELSAAGHVTLSQEEAYGDVTITLNPSATTV